MSLGVSMTITYVRHGGFNPWIIITRIHQHFFKYSRQARYYDTPPDRVDQLLTPIG